MSDVKVIRYLLANNGPLLAVVAAAKIFAGPVPQGTAVPAIGITHISGVWGKEITAQSKNCVARVQVTVMASTYTQQKQIMTLVRTAVPRSRGTINGVSVVDILRQADGPDFRNDDAGIFMQVQDFMVHFSE